MGRERTAGTWIDSTWARSSVRNEGEHQSAMRCDEAASTIGEASWIAPGEARDKASAWPCQDHESTRRAGRAASSDPWWEPCQARVAWGGACRPGSSAKE